MNSNSITVLWIIGCVIVGGVLGHIFLQPLVDESDARVKRDRIALDWAYNQAMKEQKK